MNLRKLFSVSLILALLLSVLFVTAVGCSAEEVPLQIWFETESSFFGDDVEIVLKASNSKAKIYYTLDGSDPDTTSKVYASPIRIEAPQKVKAYTVRAYAVYKKILGSQQSEVITRTFFVGQNINERFDTLVFAVTSDPYNLFDYEHGILVAGKVRDDYIAANPGAKITAFSPANFRLRGREAERPGYLEIYDSDGTMLLEQPIGIRIHGGASRSTHVKKSLKLIARKEYSPATGKFDIAIFPDNTAEDGSLITEYDRFVVRNSGNDFNKAFIRDEVLCLIAEDAGFPDTQSVRPVSVWLNGEYHGALWLHEVFHDDYFVTKYGEKDGVWGIVGGDENEDVNGDEYNKEIVNGPDHTVEDYYEMYSYAYKDLTNDAIFAKWCELVDVDNFLMYYALKIYAGDTDWPQHNNKAYRFYPTDPDAEYEAPFDGKWRYLFYDTDYAIGYAAEASDNMLFRILYGDNHRRSSNLLKAVLRRPDMKAKFAAIMCDFMAGAFEPDRFAEVLDALHQSRRNETDRVATLSTLDSNTEAIKKYVTLRPANIRQQLVSVLGIRNTTYRIQVNANKDTAYKVNTYTTDVNETFSGRYFTVSSITVEAVPKEGFALDHWIVNGETVTDTVLHLTDDDGDRTNKITVEAVMKSAAGSLVVQEVSVTSGYDYITLKNIGTEDFDLTGMTLSDKDNDPDRYTVPTCVLKPNETVTFYCENTEENTGFLLPFNFKIGEIILLQDQDGKDVIRFTIPKITNKTLYIRRDNGDYVSVVNP